MHVPPFKHGLLAHSSISKNCAKKYNNNNNNNDNDNDNDNDNNNKIKKKTPSKFLAELSPVLTLGKQQKMVKRESLGVL